MKRLNKLSLENFRIFSGLAEFSFNDLNIYTGANNSGKSTIIKAIKLFSEGLKTSDFPYLNLISDELNLGSYSDVINRYVNKKSFKIGFNTQIKGIDEDFRLVYTFSNGSEKQNEFRDNAVFSTLDLINSKGVLFLQILSNEVESDEIVENFKDKPNDSVDPGVIDFRLHLGLLAKYLPLITNKEFNLLLEHLTTIKSVDNYWWGECFGENEYMFAKYDLSKFHLRDFEKELYYDSFFNIGNDDLRKALDFQPNEYIVSIYQDLIDNTEYFEFISLVIRPILDSISMALEVFRNNNIIHFSPEVIHHRLISFNNQTEYLQYFYRNPDESIGFIREALSIFDIDGIVEVKNHLNTAFEISLIADVEVVLNSNVKARESKKLKGISFPPIERFNDYKANPRINIADLGKGATNIIKLVMKTATVINAIRDERSLKEDLPKMQGRKPERVIRKVILVEEPEAFLHPNWQSRLADFFVFCMTKYDIQFIVETHSSYLIQRMQYLVAKKEIDPERINLLYFNKCSEDEKYYKINIRKDGILKENFGTGFYDETANLTAAILNAQNLN